MNKVEPNARNLDGLWNSKSSHVVRNQKTALNVNFNEFMNNIHETISQHKSEYVRKPSWYGQFGEMTRFVPPQYRDPNFNLPALPQKPELGRATFMSQHNGLNNQEMKALWELEKSERQTNISNYQNEIEVLKNSLNQNFQTLPLDIKNQAIAARNAWLETAD